MAHSTNAPSELNDSNSRACIHRHHETVHGRFECQAAQSPDVIALTGEEGQLTYSQLERRANQLAHFLLKKGVRPEDRVGVLLKRSTAAVVSFLAILKAGAAYVPLDRRYPQERLDFMVDDAGLSFTITEDTLVYGAEEISELPAHPPLTTSPIDGVAYVIYTSGSTGTPKGVEIRHTGILHMVIEANCLRVSDISTFLHVSSISFDAAVLEIWSPLLHGGQLVIAPDGPLSTRRLTELLQSDITHSLLPTALFHRQAEESPESFSRLHTLAVGGEVLSASHAAKIRAAYPELRLMNLYGPTEATVYSTFHVVGDITSCESVPIGRPIPNARILVLDDRFQPVEEGSLGELFVGGPGLARGYLNRPDLTSERFIRDPSDTEEIVYRTGDLVRRNESGDLIFCGRTDNQVKIYGYRIELGEVEAFLQRHESVKQALAAKCEDEFGVSFLAVYYTTHEAVPVTSSELAAYLRLHLPRHMIPRTFIHLAKIPVTVGGKVDRGALPEAAAGSMNRLQSMTLEHQVREIWKSVLSLDHLDLDDNLFDAGGASLHAFRIHQETMRIFEDVEIGLMDVFSYPSVREYSAHLKEKLCETKGTGPTQSE
ncbi:amino acid adenylation domain-containing protein [Streptomyces sp. NPDC004787]|uniref:non-ribosomal peptide synthetase n=1 Tax=Streptomyces sp. NPDC004787 TaxID=3154291 RepID=UPI0033AB52D3